MLFGFIACREYSDRKLRAKNGSGELAGSHISERENEIA